MDDLDKLKEQYKKKFQKELGNQYVETVPKEMISKEYVDFRSQFMPKTLTLYEKVAKFCGKVGVKPDPKKAEIIKESLKIAHLEITPTDVYSFALLMPMLIAMVGSIVSFLLFNDLFFVMFFLFIGLVLILPLSKYPSYVANSWRMSASNQMVQSIFYVVTYMRHTSNLENGIRFASEHLAPPLSLDFKRILWDVEVGRYTTVKESLDAYLQSWLKWNREFVESFHLIEGSLYESSEDRRLSLLDKSLDVMLSETYEKMLHYAHNLKSPITMLHMLGVILPILGLVILPLVVSFIQGAKWYHLAALYNLILPLGVYALGKNILSTRPTGYGSSDITKQNPELRKYKNIIINLGFTQIKLNPLWVALSIGGGLFFIGILPPLMHMLGMSDIDFVKGGAIKLLDYRTITPKMGIPYVDGPFGLGAGVFSFALTMAFGIGFGIYYRLRSKNVIKIRNETKKLENEFASALFQLGNRLGDELPLELAIPRVAEAIKGTASGHFFEIVTKNITRLGMSVKQAIYDPKLGALIFYPSPLIESSMKVLIESSAKGPKVAAQALMNISRYIKEIHRVNERLKDLMADVIASMKMQTSFLAPSIAGIVIGISSMVSTILTSLSTSFGDQSKLAGQTGALSFLQSFGAGVPIYYFQIIVGIYVVQIVYILTVLGNGIENGSDALNERYLLGANLVRSCLTYVILGLSVMVLFNLLALKIMSSTIG